MLCTASKLQAQEDSTAPPDIIEEYINEGVKNEGDEEDEFSYPWNPKNVDQPFRAGGSRKVPAEQIRKLKEDESFWYANAVIEKQEPKKQVAKPGNYVPLGQRQWFQTVLWIVIIGGFVAFIMIYLAGNRVGLFSRKNVQDNPSEDGDMPEDIFAINYQKEIEKASNAGNFRLAVRLMYLRLLKQMAEKNIIRYTQDKTNFDYLLQLHPTRYYKDFFRVTRNYEYSWYGKFDVNEHAYKTIRSDFDQLERDLH